MSRLTGKDDSSDMCYRITENRIIAFLSLDCDTPIPCSFSTSSMPVVAGIDIVFRPIGIFGEESAVVLIGFGCSPFAHWESGSVAIDDGVVFVFAKSGRSVCEFWHGFFSFLNPDCRGFMGFGFSGNHAVKKVANPCIYGIVRCIGKNASRQRAGGNKAHPLMRIV